MNRDTQTSGLHEERLDRAVAVLLGTGARTVLDLGCGSGSLIRRLLAEPQFEQITGVEESGLSLRQAREMLKDTPEDTSSRVRFLCRSLLQPETDLRGFDAAALIEVIEHIPSGSLSLLERTLFEFYRPGALFLTTPNREYNPLFDVPPGQFRDPDHQFEWDRTKFRQWVQGVGRRHGYDVRIGGVGEMDPEFGTPTQTALFTRQ